MCFSPSFSGVYNSRHVHTTLLLHVKQHPFPCYSSKASVLTPFPLVQCGIVLSLRPEKDTIQIWNRSADPAVYQKITGELHSTLGLGSSEELLYQIHAVRFYESSLHLIIHNLTRELQGSMDFNANVRNKNSPVTKRRQGGVDNLSNKKEGNGFQQTNSPSAFVRHNNHHNGRHQYRNSGHNKTNGTPPEVRW